MKKERPKRLDGSAARVPLPAKVRPDIRDIVERIGNDDDRTLSNTVEHLLAESPRVKKLLNQLAVVPAQ